jgi:hypothetical protein
MNNREVLQKILDSAKASLESLKPALGQRHFAACMITETGTVENGKQSLYFVILQAETKLWVLIKETEKLLKEY